MSAFQELSSLHYGPRRVYRYFGNLLFQCYTYVLRKTKYQFLHIKVKIICTNSQYINIRFAQLRWEVDMTLLTDNGIFKVKNWSFWCFLNHRRILFSLNLTASPQEYQLVEVWFSYQEQTLRRWYGNVGTIDERWGSQEDIKSITDSARLNQILTEEPILS